MVVLEERCVLPLFLFVVACQGGGSRTETEQRTDELRVECSERAASKPEVYHTTFD